MSPEPPTLAWGRAWALLCRHGAASCPAPLGPGLGISAPRSSALCGVRQEEGKQLLAGPCLAVERLGERSQQGRKGRSWQGVLCRAGADGSSAGGAAGEGFLQKGAKFPQFSRRLNPLRGFQGVPNASWCSNYAFKWRGGRKIAPISCRAPAAFSVAGLGRGAAGAQVPFQDLCTRTRTRRVSQGRQQNSTEDPRVNFIPKRKKQKTKQKQQKTTKPNSSIKAGTTVHSGVKANISSARESS